MEKNEKNLQVYDRPEMNYISMRVEGVICSSFEDGEGGEI